jgi:hypothetical protein
VASHVAIPREHIGIKQRHADDVHEHGGFAQRRGADGCEITGAPDDVDGCDQQSKNRAKAAVFEGMAKPLWRVNSRKGCDIKRHFAAKVKTPC